MAKEQEQNLNQIIRKDAKNCFVEVLNDKFNIGRLHLFFATYDVNKPVKQRQTNKINIYLPIEEVIELCRQLSSGEFRYMLNKRKENKDGTPLYESLGGTSAKRLKSLGQERNDKKSLSRMVTISAGNRSDILFVAQSGPGEEDERGLIVPRFGNQPEDKVVVSMTFEAFSELLLVSKTHYDAWLTGWYLHRNALIQSQQQQKAQAQGKKNQATESKTVENDYADEYDEYDVA